jgi:hypothetical protein
MSNRTIRDDLNYGLAAFGVQIPERVNLDEWAAKLADQPCQNTVTFATAAAVLFYIAERGHNPKVNDIYDALVYCTTNLSVGYSDIFARTPAGKLIGSALMTLGPAMSGRALDGPKPSVDPQQEILSTLQQILARLQPDRSAASEGMDGANGSNGHP